MFWVQLYGRGAEGDLHSEDVAIPFEAYVIAGEMARGTLSAQTCSWGKPEGYRILDDIKRVITEARFEG
jgi:hypothetical protein